MDKLEKSTKRYIKRTSSKHKRDEREELGMRRLPDFFFVNGKWIERKRDDAGDEQAGS